MLIVKIDIDFFILIKILYQRKKILHLPLMKFRLRLRQKNGETPKFWR